MTNNNNVNFLNDLFTFFSKLVIKNTSMAEQYETTKSKEKARYYMAAFERSDSFTTYEALYTKDDLLTIGVPVKEVDHYFLNLHLLSDVNKEKLLNLKRNQVISRYEEENQYYRMISGLPPIGREAHKVKGRDVTTLTVEEVAYTYKNEINALKNIYTDLSDRYLHYLGENKVNIYQARKAKNLEILYHHDYIFDSYLTRKIIEMYYETAAYFESVFYDYAFEKQDRYSHFLILAIVFSTINKVLSEPIRLSIQGEFSDIEVLRDIFLSYNLPFDPLVPKRYLQRIVKNINELFAYKGTNQVLIDIVSLFGYDKITLNKYYLIKEMKKDDNGKFIFNGTNEEKYELNFLEVPITEDVDNGLFNRDIKRVKYEVLTEDDPFWGGTEKIRTKQKLLDTDFNYCNTKYLSINTLTNISQIIQETCYFFNFINSAQEGSYIDKLEFVDSEIKESSLPIKLFDLIVAMNILICKKLGYEDLIIYASTAISSLYGFNFKGNEETMKQILDKYPNFASKVKYGQVRSLFRNSSYTKSDLIEIFFQNLDYKTDLENALIECNDKKEYDMLSEIYRYNCYSEAVHSIFKSKISGVYFRKYSDYLKENDMELYKFVEKHIEESDHDTALQKLFDCADLYLEDVRFTSMFLNSSISDRLRQYIFSLLSYFKAYTVDIKNFNVFYLIDDKFSNNIKFIDEIAASDKTSLLADSTFLNYYEMLLLTKEINRFDDLLKQMVDRAIYLVTERKDEFYVLERDSSERYHTTTYSTYNAIYDFITNKVRNRQEQIEINESCIRETNKEDYMDDLYDIVTFISQKKHSEKLYTFDCIKGVTKYHNDSIMFDDSILNNSKQKNIMNFSDNVEIISFDKEGIGNK